MDLSNDLISKFVKITNDEGNKNSKESVVYGTTVEYDGEMYVRIDGSDLITPVDTTADIKADERVTVMIKDHTATVTGNISDPSASSSKLGTLGSQISEFDIVIANKVSTELLEAEIAQIEILIAEKADIAELSAIRADIENLNAENANIENLVANKADITDLNATNANITNLDAEIADIRTLVNGNLTSDNIQSLNLTAANTTIQNALIKNAMIDSVAANKIQTGVLDTNSVTIQSEDGSMILTGSVQQFKDENGTVRIQIGKDGGGNFTFILYDETGRGVLIDESGIQSSDAIADGLIVDAKVADGANIAGSKLDISSVITEINEDDSTTIKSNKIYLDDQEQSLTVAFNALKTKVETIQDVTIDGDLSSIVEQVQSNTTQIEVNKEKIATLVAENAIITKEVSDLEGNIVEVSSEMDTKFTALEQDLSGFKMTVDEAYASKKEVTDLENELTTNYSTTSATESIINQKANEITSSISDTYASKQSVTNLEGTLLSDYSTTEDMHSAINQKANEITSSVSETYATKKSVTDVENNLATNYTTTEDMSAVIEQKVGEINSEVISNMATKESVTDLANNLASNYSTTTQMNSAINQKANQITQSVSESYATKQSVTDLNNNLTNNYSTTTQMNSAIDQKANQITQSVSESYATKQSVIDLNSNLTNNYSTTSAMNSAINQKANQITQSVSETYTTKTEFNNLEIGGTNLYLNSNFVTNPQLSALSSGSQYQVAQTVDGGNVKANYGGKVLYVYGTTGDIYAELAQQVILESNTTYTVSFDYYGAGAFSASSGYIYLIASDGDIQFVTLPTGYNNNKKRERKQVTFTTDSTHVKCMLRFGMWVNGAAWIAIDGIKLEKGNKATAWSPAPEDTTGSISSLTTKVQTAESQLSKSGLTTIIGDYYTTTSDVNGIVTAKGYATTSQVQQTKNELTATFKSSGGYNLIKNGRAVMDTSFWKSNGGGISRATNAAGGYIGTYFTTGLPNGIMGTEWIELKNNTDYVYQAMLFSPDIDIPNDSNGPLHMQTNSTQSSGHTQVTVLDYNNAVPRSNWTQCYVHFRTAASGRVYFMPFIYLYNITAPIYASEIMLSESTVPLPYSPHPTEIYDGITKIDKNGITVTQSNAKSKTTMTADGFAITRTDNGKDIFRVGSNGKLTLNGDFLCYRDGANQSGPRLESSGAMMYGYNDTGGNHPVFASGLWADQDMGYFSVGYTRADVTDANGCLWLSPQHDNAGCRLTFSRLIGTEMKTTNLYFQKDGAIDFIQNLRGYNTTDDNYTYRFDSGVSVQAFRCNHIRTHNIYPRNNGSHNIGSPTMRYKDVFFDSASTTNNEFRIGTVNTDGSWKTYGPLCVNSSSGYVFPSGNANLSLGMSSYRFHTLFCTSNPNVSSDKRMKTDIHYLGMPYEPEVVNGRSKVNMDVTTGDMYDFVKDDLRLASYRYKVNIGKGDTSVDYGFIAQDILYTKVGSEIVQLEDPDNLDSNLSYNQGNYIATIAGALQEEIKIRDKQIAELEDKVIGRLQEEIKMKDAQISDLETRLAKLESIVEQLIEK